MITYESPARRGRDLRSRGFHFLRAQGVETRDQVSRPGARGARVGFIDPRALAEVELELVERAS